MSKIDCLTGILKKKAQTLIKDGASESVAIAGVLNEEYNSINKSLIELKDPEAGTYEESSIITIPEAQEEQVKEYPDTPVITLGKTVNEDGLAISEILSELITAYVDVANDPYILDINAVNEAANTIFMMVRQGISLEKIFFLMNQPSVKKYLDTIANENSLAHDKTKSRIDIATEVFKSYKPGYNIANSIWYAETKIERGEWAKKAKKGRIYTDFTKKELIEGITEKGADKDIQVKALDIFLEYDRQSNMFQNMIMSSSPDTQRFKTFNMLESQIKLQDKVRESGMFGNYDKLFSETFVGSFDNAKKAYKNAISDLLLAQNKGYKGEIDTLKDVIIAMRISPAAKETLLTKVDNAFTYYMLNKSGVIQHNLFFKNYFQENSVAKQLKYLTEVYNKNDNLNSFLNGMLPEINPFVNQGNQGFDSVKPRQKKLPTINKEIMYEDLRFLREYDEYNSQTILGMKPGESFYKRLVVVAMMQTGLDNSPYNILNLIPTEDYFNFVRESIEIAAKGTTEIGDFTELFRLNNPAPFYGKGKTRGLPGQPFNVGYNRALKRYWMTFGDSPAVMQKGYPSKLMDYTTTQRKMEKDDSNLPPLSPENSEIINNC